MIKFANFKKIKNFLVKFKNEFSFFPKQNNFKKFIVLARSRTGSNLLVSFLNSHKNIYSEGEIFNKIKGKNFEQVLLNIFKKQPVWIKAKGFKIFYYHPNDKNCPSLWKSLYLDKNLHVIHLKRRNILKTIISRKIADIENIWKKSSFNLKKNKERIKFNFNFKELKREFEKTRKWEKNGDKMFKNHPFLTVYYEDLAQNKEKTFRKITDFLGIKYAKPKTFLKKQNNRKLKEIILNYDELKKDFSKTKWASFFNE
jgi:LPS sulfotransferase NodH